MNYFVFWTEIEMSGVDREICDAAMPQLFTVEKPCRPLSLTASQCPTRHLKVAHGIPFMPLPSSAVHQNIRQSLIGAVWSSPLCPSSSTTSTNVTRVTESHKGHKGHR